MARFGASIALCALQCASTVSASSLFRPPPVRNAALLQTWEKELDGAGGKDTPVTRVVGLLKNMMGQLQKDMDQDEALYKELSCWCNNNNYEKKEAVKASTAKIEELEATIETLTARSAELATTIKELEEEYAADKQALDEATALREKQLAEFHGMEKDDIQALENLKAAIVVLSKHQGPENAAESSVAGGAVFKTEKDSWSLLSLGSKDFPWGASHEDRESRELDNFLRATGMDTEAAVPESKPVFQHKFLQQATKAEGASQQRAAGGMSEEESVIVKRALKSAAAFVQAHQGSAYFPAYSSQSGEIFGVLKQLKEQMEGELSEAQKLEQERSAAFAELRAAKEAELENGYKMSEQKEDEKAQTDNNLAEAKEDLEQEKKVLGEDSEFLRNLEAMCTDGRKNFDERKNSRLSEMQAVAETIEILQADEARDAMSGTYSSFVQVSSSRQSAVRRQVAEALRAQARKSKNPELSILATSVELDSFTKVKKAIDDMISMLKQQQEDEVKKNDFCKDELHKNEMSTAKATDKREALEAHIGELESTIKTLEDGIEAAKAQIAQLQLDLQRASEDRQKENLEFQRTVADQTMTVEVLKKALDRLATYYDLLQTQGRAGARQTPPVAQMEYKPNQGATGVMEMIEKLVHEANDLKAESKKGESAAQAAYEQTIADTNGSVEALQKEIVSKTKAKAEAHKDKLQAESDHSDTMKELEGLAKYNADLHEECDYVMKNFEVRQSGRQAEIEALQQAKQILSGATLS